MSVLSKEAGERCAALLHKPLPQHQEAYDAFHRGEELEYRHADPDGHIAAAGLENSWRPHVRSGHDFHLGGAWTSEPNWQTDAYEWRARSQAGVKE